MIITIIKLLFAAALVSASDERTRAVYENHVLVSDILLSESFSCTLDTCVDLCRSDASCSAISFNTLTGACLRTTCGNMVLKRDEYHDTVVFGTPVVSGIEIPKATHDFALTDRCGTSSLGGVSSSAMGINGLSFSQNTNSKFGAALTFPGVNGKGATTFADNSFSTYANKDASVSVALYVYFDGIPANACLFEFQSDKYSWHYWLWPDGRTLFNNAATSSWTAQVQSYAYTFQPNVWYHIAWSYNARTGLNSAYVNGTFVNSAYLANVDKYPINAVSIGGRLSENLGYYKGSTYCVSVFNKALNSFEVKQHQRSCVDGKLTFAD